MSSHSLKDLMLATSGSPGRQDPAEDRRRVVYYGRRQSRKLPDIQQDLMARLLPQLAIPLPADPGTLVPGATDYWLEVGFGGGEHLAGLAKAHPEIGMLGCEPFVNGVSMLVQQVDSCGLDGNVRIWPDDARVLLDGLPDGMLGRVYLLFPDPWPKRRHHKRRFVQPESLDDLARVLRPGGSFHFASDHPGVMDWMLELTEAHPAFEGGLTPAAELGTRYERKGLAGHPPRYAAYRRV